MLSEQPVLSTHGTAACAHYLATQTGYVLAAWEDGMGHARAIHINPSTHIFEGATDLRCEGLAPGWQHIVDRVIQGRMSYYEYLPI